MSGGGGGGETQSTQDISPYSLKSSIHFNRGLWDVGEKAMFPDQTYAGPSEYTQQGIAGLGNVDYSPTLDLYRNTIGGDYLGLNPAMQRAVMDPAIENVNARFGAAGRFGDPANAFMAQKAGMQSLMPYYDQERTRQMQAAAAFPMAQEQLYRSQLGAGQLQEGYEQQGIQEAMQRWYDDPKLRQLQQWQQLYPNIGFPGGGVTSSSVDQSGGSSLAGGLGGALAGGAAGAAGASSLWGPGALAAGSFAAPIAWPLVGAGALAGGLLGAYG